MQEAFEGRVKRGSLFFLVPVLFGILLFNMSTSQLSAQTESPEQSPLDGTTWSIKAKPFSQAKRLGGEPFSDILTFEQGKFTSTTCAKAGFGPAAYSRAMRDAPNDPWSFSTVEQISDKGEKTAWAGHATGNSIVGTMTWERKDGMVLIYEFSGKRTKTKKTPSP